MAQRTTIAPETEETINGEEAVSECRHHWVIQPATGPVSQGVCQACGDARDFMNYVESASWGDSRLGNRSSSRTNDVAQTVAVRRDDEEEEQ